MSKLKFLLIVLIFTLSVSGCSKSKGDVAFEKPEDLNKPQYTIGAEVGDASEPFVAKVFPNAVEKQFQNFPDIVVALENGQVDAIVRTRSALENVLREKSDTLQILPQQLAEVDISMVISPKTKIENLQEEINEFLKAKKVDGTLDKAYKYWFIDHNEKMPADIPEIQGATKKLVVGTTGTSPPANFYSSDKIIGFDIEIITRFAAEYGYEVEYRVEDFISLLTDAEFGKIDLISGSIIYTAERAERVIFPETPFFTIPVSVMTRKVSAEKNLSNIKRPTDLNDAKYIVGVVTGSSTETFVPKFLPNATLKHYPSVSEMILALEQKKIDAGAYSQPPLEIAVSERPDKLKILEEPLLNTEICMVVSPKPHIEHLEEQVNEFLAKHKADGSLDKIIQYWLKDKNTKLPEIPEPENPSQTLIVSTSGTIPPYNFYIGDKLSGMDIELIKRFAHEYNYKLEFRVEELPSQLLDVEFGKIDMLSGTITYTDERAEHVHFAKPPVLNVPSSIIMRNEQAQNENFFGGLKNSFEKTLIREERYKMILEGLKVTLILAIGSLILGTILGFIFCMMKRSKIKIVSTAMTAFIALISGLPIVLTLMICFYIVFSGTSLTEITIAIIAFAIDFGCYVAIILNSGIESVAVGEIEAAESMGMSNLQIFAKIIFPQAIQKIFGVYKRQVISLIKATSIVGYIAVQDLTKVSDIIRARTYDAFFSLIFTAAIYFLIARICIFMLNVAESKLNRRKRNVE